MLKTKWVTAFVFLSLLTAIQTYAGGHPTLPEGAAGKPAADHHDLALYYEEQAQLNKTKALDWDFLADYYQEFPSTFTGKMAISEHSAYARSGRGV